ncbi:MAG: tetratricopeptide repeat protein, partial [Bacteroidota bacterium]
AIFWFTRSAEQGNKYAQVKIADIYYDGIIINTNLGQALYWYEKAAEQDILIAQIMVGKMYCIGQGIEKDFKKAAYWLEKAKNRGDELADELWEEFELEKYK